MDIGKELLVLEADITEAGIMVLAERYLPLKINGIDDKPGMAAVKAARIDVKNRRLAITKRGKQMRDEAHNYNKAVLARERELVGKIEPIEQHLEFEEAKIERMKREAAAKAAEEKRLAEEKAALEVKMRFAERRNILEGIIGCIGDEFGFSGGGLTISVEMVSGLDDTQFQLICDKFTEAIDAAAAKAEAEAKAKAEAERVRLETEKQLAEMQAKIAALEEEKRQAEELVEKALQAEADRQKKAADAVIMQAKIDTANEKARAALAIMAEHDRDKVIPEDTKPSLVETYAECVQSDGTVQIPADMAPEEVDLKHEPEAGTEFVDPGYNPNTDACLDHELIMQLASRLEETRFFYECKMHTGDGQAIMNKAKTTIQSLVKYLRKEGGAL